MSRDQLNDRAAARARHPSMRGNDVQPVGSVIPEVIRRLAELNDTSEKEIIARLRGKGRGDVVTPDDVR